MKIGVLALQGAVTEHIQALKKCGVEAVEVKDLVALEQVEGLILPGGESTTIGKLLSKWGLLEPLREKAYAGFPLFGTCAGMILLAKEVEDGIPEQLTLKLMNIKVKRNAFGRQVESFEAPLEMPGFPNRLFTGVFIRAPLILEIKNSAQVLAKYKDQIVAARENNLLACAFHPELTEDLLFHKYFIEMVKQR
jgi:5'-phosphate synthase pdxT subunit